MPLGGRGLIKNREGHFRPSRERVRLIFAQGDQTWAKMRGTHCFIRVRTRANLWEPGKGLSFRGKTRSFDSGFALAQDD